MNDLSCPHCEKPGISVIRKMFLGPALPATCKSCGKKIGVPYASILAAMPLLAAFYIATMVEPVALKAALWVVGSLLMGVIHLKWIPLERR